MKQSRFMLSVIALFFSLTLFPTNTKLKTKQAGISTFKREKDSVLIAFWIKNTERINTLSELIIQPVISNGKDSLALTSYAIRGRYNKNLHKRDSIFGFTNRQVRINSGNPVIISNNPKKDNILYMDTIISYSSWMKNANLKLHIDLCGCGNEQKIIHESKKLDYKLSPEEIHPFLVFSLSKADESIIKRAVNYTLYFRVNENIVDSGYMDNNKTLQRLKNDINMLSESGFDISNITVTGYASPEGPLSANSKLAASRSLAFTEEIRKLRAEQILKKPETYLTDEDWQGLISELDSDTSTMAQIALGIICNKMTREEQKSELKYIQKGKVYDFLKKNYLNRLRKSDLMLEYELNPEKIIQPDFRSEEMPHFIDYGSLFEYANNITDSVKRAQIIYKAAEIYSHHDRAVLNAGIMALKERKIEKAETYLKSIENDNNPSELENALGVLAMYKGQYEEAGRHFQKAMQGGLSGVDVNISILNSLN